jgi:hypothetical protein
MKTTGMYELWMYLIQLPDHPSANTETCSPNIDVAPTSIIEYLLVTTARFTAEPKRPYRSFRLLRLISLSIFQSTFRIHKCSAAAISFSSS